MMGSCSQKEKETEVMLPMKPNCILAYKARLVFLWLQPCREKVRQKEMKANDYREACERKERWS